MPELPRQSDMPEGLLDLALDLIDGARRRADIAYCDELRELAQQCARAAGRAESIKAYGLAEVLTMARDSASSWANALEREALDG